MIGWTFPASLLHSLHMTHDMTRAEREVVSL